MYIRDGTAADHTSINFGIRFSKEEEENRKEKIISAFETDTKALYPLHRAQSTGCSQIYSVFLANEYVCIYGREKNIVLCNQHNVV